jgi:hypothetical protein
MSRHPIWAATVAATHDAYADVCDVVWSYGVGRGRFRAQLRGTEDEPFVLAQSMPLWSLHSSPPDEWGAALEELNVFITTLERSGWEVTRLAESWYGYELRRPRSIAARPVAQSVQSALEDLRLARAASEPRDLLSSPPTSGPAELPPDTTPQLVRYAALWGAVATAGVLVGLLFVLFRY